jgi:hypothetical protein
LNGPYGKGHRSTARCSRFDDTDPGSVSNVFTVGEVLNRRELHAPGAPILAR